jgi:hypothetical protein
MIVARIELGIITIEGKKKKGEKKRKEEKGGALP